ncbi:polysaccharide deacetylase [Novosphingobium aromaticivorans DSM 12444]|uniref:Chitooligosaccharide deacetylase n=1 Tax=Novosphingobium aromaticivorans (strain ATCC 700278 / DSM 12444 / CCUG 56034 / CIP 105152 / NBRC 16084 / F199) TaxID=279238 RepID=Q2G7Y8_NOVAD|nr:glycosyltransferase [Novosphingobium aromaticivorans]ABD26035.1 polysaccharide deacetylase [Novosphingobium aromaticivorans DSM 12444]SCY61004.1 Glycosyltransferase, catalytic subunit of cellulose synthase and poly-beta-1,6-N-acetylglucosamine synthase [Novosphingobium aromaticivorans]
MTRPIFYDPTGRRSLLAKRSLAVVFLAVILAALAFATTLVAVPRQRALSLPQPHFEAASLHRGHGLSRLRSWLPRLHLQRSQEALAIGFYQPRSDASFQSLSRHGNQLDWVVPALLNVAGPEHRLAVSNDPRFDSFVAAGHHHYKVLPMVQNVGGDGWDGANVARILENATERHALERQLADYVARRGDAGLVLDFEDLPATAMRPYVAFLRETNALLPAGAQLAVTAPAGEDDWPIAALGRAADKVILMAYDEHWQNGAAGPIASQTWFTNEVEKSARALPADRLVIALGSYGYDWHQGGTDALSLSDAWLAAHDSHAPIIFDKASGNAGFAYEQDGVSHTVWMLDAATDWNEMLAVQRLGIGNLALWRLGTEDPGFWNDLAALRSGKAPDLSRLVSEGGNDVEGTGEILRITATPVAGSRTVAFGDQHLIRDERYGDLPTPFVVRRTGAANPKLLALTFDDGPDPKWTPKVLSTLEAAHVPATFFVIGENALVRPDLLRRMVADGDEIGNHTYTHPNLAGSSEAETRLEINATQRLVQAYTGRSMTLFRAPYFGDAEPTTADELQPALRAQQAGYTIVGLHVDPNDWQNPGTDEIVRQVVNQIHNATEQSSSNVILLHDGGGDRSQTVAALPRIVAVLRAEGYSFVTASQLVGIPPQAAMPRLSSSDLAAVRVDVAAFLALDGLVTLFSWLFFVAIALGIARAVIMAGLAWWQSRSPRAEPPAFEPTVSVIIPAWNEERVIAASVERVLASDYPALQVIVADDGSKDATSAVVARHFGHDPRVTLLTLANGGKAAALNRALRHATGEVVIALDADTQFEPLTIRRLARWFADPRIGAVAGDARVGNRVNLVTRWQAVEYITAQNLERRALAGFDAMTVVPGAVGAWRRAALDSVGGYPENTLAEDQDLTIAIQRKGWRVTYDPRAVAWTEAPQTFRALARQRYRWAFGTLQCLWKHRKVITSRKPAGLGLVGLPQAWLFQIAFAAISPLIDGALIASIISTVVRVVQHGWAQTQGDLGRMAIYWSLFTAIDVICGWIAYRLDDKRPPYPAHLLVAQRIVYRQIMYWVVLRALASAIGGWIVGWGKLERTGTVSPAPERA